MNFRDVDLPAISKDRAACEINAGEIPTSCPISCNAASVMPLPTAGTGKEACSVSAAPLENRGNLLVSVLPLTHG
jgi:hypothetical protein